MVSAGLLRIFGRDLAELPLVATTKENQGKVRFERKPKQDIAFRCLLNICLCLEYIPVDWSFALYILVKILTISNIKLLMSWRKAKSHPFSKTGDYYFRF